MKLAAWLALVSIPAPVAAQSSPAPVAAQSPAWDRNLRPAITVAGQERARSTLAERMRRWQVPGVGVAVIDDCRIVDARGFGVATAAGAPVTDTTLFQAASLSKPVAAVTALRLVEQGAVTLDGDVREVLSRWTLPAGPVVTLRRLLGHTAGIGVASYPGYPPGAALPTLPQILAGAAPAGAPPVRVEAASGAAWRYSGGGYAIAQAVMEDAAGAPFTTLARRLVLDPVGMGDSGFDQPIAPDRAGRAAMGFAEDGTPLPGGWRIYPELAAAGLWTTPSDLARFAVAVARSVRGEPGALLRPESARAMIARGPGDWGLGVALGPSDATLRIRHTGSNAGFASQMSLDPEACRGAVVMTNGDGGGPLVGEVIRAIGESYGWPDVAAPPTRRTIPLTPAIVRRFAGKWRVRDAPAEHFAISPGSVGLRVIRPGHAAQDLRIDDAGGLFSPDTGFVLAAQGDAPVASVLMLTSGNARAIADRVR